MGNTKAGLDRGLLRVVALVGLMAAFGVYSVTLATGLALHTLS